MARMTRYETLMKQYADEWRVRRCEDQIYVVCGRWGNINPYDEAEEFYMASCEFESARRKNARIRAAQKIVQGFEITQEGDTDVCFIFRKNTDVRVTLRRLKPLLGLYDRKHYPNRKLSGAALNASIHRGGDQ